MKYFNANPKYENQKIYIQYVIKRLMKGPTVKISVQSIDEYDTV